MKKPDRAECPCADIDKQLDDLGSAVKTHNALIGNAPLGLVWGVLRLICKCLIEIARNARLDRTGTAGEEVGHGE